MNSVNTARARFVSAMQDNPSDAGAERAFAALYADLRAFGWPESVIRDIVAEAIDDLRGQQEFRDCQDEDHGCDEPERDQYDDGYSDRLDMGRNDAGEWLGFM